MPQSLDRNTEPGLYVVQQFRFPFMHVAFADAGNQLGLADVAEGAEPVIAELSPSGFRYVYLSAVQGTWNIVRPVADESAARTRLLQAATKSTYALLSNNCEHFVSYVETGVAQSPQVAAWVVGGLGLLLIACAKAGGHQAKPRRRRV